jgi:Raf kinase inhibitor-like YbhB/YbcL family protein
MDGAFQKTTYKLMNLILVMSSYLLLLGFLAACASTNAAGDLLSEQTEKSAVPAEPGTETSAGALALQSAAFNDGDAIPIRYSCDGDDISPPLNWAGIPEDTRSFVLIMEDPDAPGGTWVHWVLFNLPADTSLIDPGSGTQSDLPEDTRVGLNDWGKAAYGGPCPPNDTHRYVFTLFALDTHLDLSQGASSDLLRDAMAGHILSRDELIGTYSR